MSDNTISPLQQARQLVEKLQQRTDLTDPELKFNLATLEELLQQAALRSESMDAESLRAQLETQNDQNAKLNSVMVHEIRKPMTNIRGYADMLAKPGPFGSLNEMQQQFIDVIRANVISMEGLIANISDLGKLNFRRLRLDPKMTTFDQVMMEVKKQAEPLLQQFEHTITYNVPQGLPILVIDRLQVAKVISHLLRNAIQYTPKGGQITVTAERQDGNRLSVKVVDNGIGMTPEELAHLGEPFYRADHELVTAQKGYGLGVPVSMGILALMGSKLTYQSQPNQGSTFSFVLTGIG
jgi:signal transduction histidine kinase